MSSQVCPRQALLRNNEITEAIAQKVCMKLRTFDFLAGHFKLFIHSHCLTQILGLNWLDIYVFCARLSKHNGRVIFETYNTALA
jgi:hypothetical protein